MHKALGLELVMPAIAKVEEIPSDVGIAPVREEPAVRKIKHACKPG